MVSASCGGTGVTTYAENMGVMAITRNLFGRTVRRGRHHRDPARLLAQVRRADPDHSGAGARRALDCGVRPDRRDRGTHLGGKRRRLLQARNLITVAVALVLGAGNFKLTVAGFTLDGIGTATFGSIILYHLLNAGMTETRTP
jgi:putative pyrimidine permease RutG